MSFMSGGGPLRPPRHIPKPFARERLSVTSTGLLFTFDDLAVGDVCIPAGWASIDDPGWQVQSIEALPTTPDQARQYRVTWHRPNPLTGLHHSYHLPAHKLVAFHRPGAPEGSVTWYLATCIECGDMVQPFYDEGERDEWARSHVDANKHTVARTTEVRT